MHAYFGPTLIKNAHVHIHVLVMVSSATSNPNICATLPAVAVAASGV